MCKSNVHLMKKGKKSKLGLVLPGSLSSPKILNMYIIHIHVLLMRAFYFLYGASSEGVYTYWAYLCRQIDFCAFFLVLQLKCQSQSYTTSAICFLLFY